MIIEHAVLNIKSGEASEFISAIQEAYSYIARQPGFQSMEVLPATEKEDQFLLLVRWDNIESHRDGFRRSQDYQKWRALLHDFYEPMPQIDYYGDTVLNV